jgi:hypothetical protein
VRVRILLHLLVIALGVWGAELAQAAGEGVTVRPGGAELLEAEPRQIVTATFRVTNTSEKRREFTAQVGLPADWKLITTEFPFELDPQRAEVRLVSFFVPRTTLAGRYPVTYAVQDRTVPSVRDRFAITVAVRPMGELGIRLLETPQTVIAGEDYKATFVVANQGNVAAGIELSVRSANQLPAAPDTEACILRPAESRAISVTVKTNPQLRQKMRHSLKLIAKAPELKKEGVQVEATSWVEIVPRISGAEDAYLRLPVQLTLRSVWESKPSTSLGPGPRHGGGFQMELSGRGPLDEAGKENLEFLFRGPDLTDESVYGSRDEYRVSYWRKDCELHLGDRVYALTPLTELSTYARGAEAKLRLDRFTLGGYTAETHWEEPRERQTAAYAQYQIDQQSSLTLAYLRKTLEGTGKGDRYVLPERPEGGFAQNVPVPFSGRGPPEGEAVTLRGQFRPFQHLGADLELGWGRNDAEGSHGAGLAYRAELEGQLGRALCQLRLIHAGPDYPGYYNDMDFVSASVAAPLWGRLGIHADYRREQDNLNRDPVLGSAPLDTYRRIGLDYRFRTGTYLSLDFQNRTREDRIPSPRFSDEEETVGLTLAHHFHRLSLAFSAERGKTWDHLAGRSTELQQYRLSTYWTPSGSLSFSSYLEYRDDGDLRTEKNRSVTAGLTTSWRLTDRTALVLDARRSDFQQAFDGNRDVFELRLTHLLASKARLSLAARHTSWRGADEGRETAVMLEYSIPLGLPLGRRKSVGAIKGRVYDEETGKGIPNTVLRLSGATAVSDGSGNYIFPSVRPGTYYLAADTQSLGIEKVPNQKLPKPIAVAGGEDSEADIGITRSATLSGRVAVYRPNETSITLPVPRREPIAGDGRCPAVATVGPADSATVGLPNRARSDEPTVAQLVEAGGVPNVFLELADGTEVQRCMTDANGAFSFASLRPGKWTLKAQASNLPEHHILEGSTLEVSLEPGQAKTLLVRVLPKRRPIRIVESGGTLTEEPKKP